MDAHLIKLYLEALHVALQFPLLHVCVTGEKQEIDLLVSAPAHKTSCMLASVNHIVTMTATVTVTAIRFKYSYSDRQTQHTQHAQCVLSPQSQTQARHT